MEINDTLFIIPARGGSKGLPRKNILPINGKPMICYSIDAARGVTSDENICVSTDDAEIKQVAEAYGLKVPFVRPPELATDTVGSREVILHTINYYKNKLGKSYSKICLLQPTSPLRTAQHIREAFELWEDLLDMVVSVKESKANPYFNLFEETVEGYLKQSKAGNFIRRQDTPKIWEYNGAIYIVRTKSILNKSFFEFKKIKKYHMQEAQSFDIDTKYDYNIIKIHFNNLK